MLATHPHLVSHHTTTYAPPSRALVDAMAAPALRRHGSAARALVLLHELLTPHEFRIVRPWYLAQRLGIHRVAASRTLARLATAGLIVRGPAERGFPTFRLPDLARDRAARGVMDSHAPRR